MPDGKCPSPEICCDTTGKNGDQFTGGEEWRVFTPPFFAKPNRRRQ